MGFFRLFLLIVATCSSAFAEAPAGSAASSLGVGSSGGRGGSSGSGVVGGRADTRSPAEVAQSLRTWDTANSRECGQGCLYARANETLTLQAFYYRNLVNEAEAIQEVAPLRSLLGETLCPTSDSREVCMQRLRVVALVSIQRYQASIRNNQAQKFKLDENPQERSTTRFHSDGVFSNLDAQGNVVSSKDILAPNFLSAQDIARFSDLRIHNVGEAVELANAAAGPLMGNHGRYQMARGSAQEQFADWMESEVQPKLEDFLMVDAQNCRGNACPGIETSGACMAAGGAWQPSPGSSETGVCYDRAHYDQALASFRGIRIGDRSLQEDMTRIAQSLRRNANTSAAGQRAFLQANSIQVSGQDRAFRPQAAGPGGAVAAPSFDSQSLRAYAEARGLFLNTTQAKVNEGEGVMPVAPPTRRPAQRSQTPVHPLSSNGGTSSAQAIVNQREAIQQNQNTVQNQVRGLDASGIRAPANQDPNRPIEAGVSATAGSFNQINAIAAGVGGDPDTAIRVQIPCRDESGNVSGFAPAGGQCPVTP